MTAKVNKNLIIILSLIGGLALALAIYWATLLNTAHSTFENYYAFRGCSELIDKKDDYGTCKTNSGQTIKIVKFENKWYLDGDLPCGLFCF